MWTVLAVILLVMRDFVPKLLTSKEAVQDLVQKWLICICGEAAGYFVQVLGSHSEKVPMSAEAPCG